MKKFIILMFGLVAFVASCTIPTTPVTEPKADSTVVDSTIVDSTVVDSVVEDTAVIDSVVIKEVK